MKPYKLIGFGRVGYIHVAEPDQCETRFETTFGVDSVDSPTSLNSTSFPMHTHRCSEAPSVLLTATEFLPPETATGHMDVSGFVGL